jgi:hypothetical protein
MSLLRIDSIELRPSNIDSLHNEEHHSLICYVDPLPGNDCETTHYKTARITKQVCFHGNKKSTVITGETFSKWSVLGVINRTNPCEGAKISSVWRRDRIGQNH